MTFSFPLLLNPACQGMGTSLFFEAATEDIAVQVCALCPARDRTVCLDWALTKPEPFGVWGGKTAAQRQNRQRSQRCYHCQDDYAEVRGLCHACSGYFYDHRSLPGPAILARRVLLRARRAGIDTTTNESQHPRSPGTVSRLRSAGG